jgi:hypothetical protein
MIGLLVSTALATPRESNDLTDLLIRIDWRSCLSAVAGVFAIIFLLPIACWIAKIFYSQKVHLTGANWANLVLQTRHG